MKVSYVECDGCGKKIGNNECYYSIDIYQKPNRNGQLTTSGMANNLEQNVKKINGKEETFCEDCINKIKNFIHNI